MEGDSFGVALEARAKSEFVTCEDGKLDRQAGRCRKISSLIFVTVCVATPH